jgi:hypothetical protein
MKKLLATLSLATISVMLPRWCCATYIPVNGSTVSANLDVGFSSVSPTNPVPVQSTGTTNISIVGGSIANTGFNVNNAPTVVTSTAGINGSTMSVVNSAGTNLSVTFPSAQAVTGTFFQSVQPVYVNNPTTTTVQNSTLGVVGTQADNTTAAGSQALYVLPGVAQTDYGNGTASTQGRMSAQDHGTDGLLWTASLPSFRPASYAASTNTLTVAASATDIAALCGNATDTVLLYGIRVSCTETTAGNVLVDIFKRSAGYTGAWSTMTNVAQDSTYAVASSSGITFTANPTVGALVGLLDAYQLGCMASTTATPNDIYISPPDWRMKPIVLRGTAQCVAVNLNGVTVTGGKFTVSFDWIETKTISP